MEVSGLNFCHLHVHSEYSLIGGTITIKKLIEKVKKWGHTHIALTDQGNLHGAIEFYLEAKNSGLVPIIGCEIFVERSQEALEFKPEQTQAFHLVVLAKNNNGYKNLLKLVSSAYIGQDDQTPPIVSRDNLQKYSHDLIVLSSSLKGEFNFWLIEFLKESQAKGLSLAEEDLKKCISYEGLKSHIEFMKNVYKSENYFIELIDNDLEIQKTLIPLAVKFAEYFSLDIVASSDAHYLDKSFKDTHALAVAIKNSLTMNDIKDRLPHDKFHLFTESEMQEAYGLWPQAITNTMKIAKQCEGLSIEMGKYYLPKITEENSVETTADVLERIAYKGLKQRIENYKTHKNIIFDEEKVRLYEERLNYELKVINQMGFPDYFLIVQDFISWAKSKKIPVGPGRGSGAGSLVAYSLKITDIDPIPYNLIFERFLNPERISMPDFDIDFCQWRRDEVIKYCVERYGSQNVAQITTFGKMQAKGAVKSVGRALNMSFNRVDRFTKLFPPDLGMTLKKALEVEPLLKEEMKKDPLLSECVTEALKLEGLVSHTSVHAAGLVISDGEMTNYLPIYTTDGHSYITQYEMKPTEKIGLVKFDFLGLKTLTVIDKCIQYAKQASLLACDFNIENIAIDDKSVFSLLSNGFTCGVFQCESLGMTQLIKKLQPSCFEDIIALVALFRPGPLGSGMVDDFIERKHGRQKIQYLHPDLEPILKETYGMILYQEQVQKIAASLASYTLGEADILRRAMGKKIPEEMEKQKNRFLEGATKNKIDSKLAEEIFDLMAEFAKYGFNKSHSAAYGLVTYQTAYLKAMYPEYFMAACMTCDLENTDKIIRYIEDCRRMNIRVLSPDLNHSRLEFSIPKKNEIRFGLSAIKGLGEACLKPLLEVRDSDGFFQSLSDLCKRVDLNNFGKKNFQILIETGACDSFFIKRQDFTKCVPDIVAYSASHHEKKSIGQMGLFDSSSEEDSDCGSPWLALELEQKEGVSLYDISDLMIEKKLLGSFITDHPANIYKQDINYFGVKIKDFAKLVQSQNSKSKFSQKTPVAIVALVTNSYQRRTKKGSLIASIRLEQNSKDFIEAVMFEKQLNELTLPSHNTMVYVTGNLEKSFRDNELRFSIDNIVPLESYRKDSITEIEINIDLAKNIDYDVLTHKLKALVDINPGSTKLNFVVKNKESYLKIKASQEYNVELNDSFIFKTLKLSEHNIFFKYNKRMT